MRDGRLDVVRALVEGSLGWGELYTAQREGRLDHAADLLKLKRSLRECVNTLFPESCEGTPKRYRVSFLKLLRLLPGEPTVETLLTLDWEALRGHYRSGSDWNHGRRAVSRLLSLLVGKAHPIRSRAIARIPIRQEAERVPDISQADLKRFLACAPTWLRPIILFLLGTGVRYGEFKAGRLVGDTFVCGTKTDASRRTIPLAKALVPIAQQALANRKSDVTIRRAWTKARFAADLPDLRRHDLRHVAAQLLDEAGRPLSSIQATLGHATISQTAKYAKQRLRKADSEALAGQIQGLL